MRGNSNCYVRKFNVLDCASYDSTTVNPFAVLLPGPHHSILLWVLPLLDSAPCQKKGLIKVVEDTDNNVVFY